MTKAWRLTNFKLYPVRLEHQSVSGAMREGCAGRESWRVWWIVFHNNLLSTYHVPGTVFSIGVPA